MKIRQDAWSHEDDLLLAETVLKHIKNGSTQLRAFDEVGDELNRTSAACGFRWNAVVRNQYDNAIQQAKRERKQRQRQVAIQAVAPQSFSSPQTSFSPPMEEEMSLHKVITYLSSLSSQSNDRYAVNQENSQLKEEITALKKQITSYQNELKQLKEKYTSVEEDYKSLIEIMNRARRMAFLGDEDRNMTSSFRMDKNGNLEKIAKAE